MNEKKTINPNTPSGALELLELVTSNLSGSRNEHLAIITAIQTLSRLVAEAVGEKKDESDTA